MSTRILKNSNNIFGISNNKKISNEDATNNDFSMENIYRLSRYSGNDKMDNSKRISYGLSTFTENFKTSLSQSYEFTKNSNFHTEQGNDGNLSDILGSIEYLKDINSFNENVKLVKMPNEEKSIFDFIFNILSYKLEPSNEIYTIPQYLIVK